MKQTLLLILLFVSALSFGQTTVTEKFENTPLTEVFNLFESKYKMKIAYDPELVEGVSISAELNNVSMPDAFKLILENTELSFDAVKSDYYSIRPSNNVWQISGKIKDEEGLGVPYAKIRILGTYKGVYANSEGAFSFEYRSDKTPQLEITSLGFEKFVISADELQSGTPIQLAPKSIEFEAVMVEYLTEGISVSEDISTVSIRLKKIGSVPGTTEPDVFQLVQNIPGINSASSTVSEIQIRGGTSDQNHLIWEGIPIYHPGHFYGMISSVNPNIIDKTELHRGIYDPYFGGKASGLIQLESIDYIPENLEAGAGLNMMQGDAYVKARLTPKLGLLLSGRRSYMDIWKSPTYLRYSDRVYQETEIQNTGIYLEEPEFSGEPGEQLAISNNFVYYDINGKLIYKPGENQLLTASGIYTKNNLDYSSEFDSDEESIYNTVNSSNLGFNLSYENHWTDKFRSTFLGSFAQYTYNFDYQLREQFDEEAFEERFEKGNLVNHYVFKWNNHLKLNDYNTVSFGYQFLSNRVDYTLITREEEDSVSELGSITGLTNVINANHTWKKGRFLTRLGGRFSHFTATASFHLEPRLYGQYTLTDWLAFKVGAGIQNQFISQVDEFENVFLGPANRVWVMAEEDVPIVKSQIINTGFVIDYKGWHFGIDAYYKQLSGIINFSENPNQSSGLLRGNGVAKGVDFLVRKRWKNYRSWISYTLSDVSYEFDEFSTVPFPAPFNQRHSLKWVNTLNWRQFEFSSSFKIASGIPYTPFAGIEEIPPEDPEEDLPDYEIIYGTPNSKTLPIFHQLDLTVFYSFPKNPEKNWKGKIGLSCYNVYNRTNFLSRTYELDVEEDEDEQIINTYTIDRYFLSITPNALIRFEF